MVFFRRKVKETSLYFSRIEGNQHIASEYSLKVILRIIKLFKVKSILEFGLGIGTVPYAVLKNFPKIDYHGTEDNWFCLNSIDKNLKDLNQLRVYNQVSEIEKRNYFDLIIIDGSIEEYELLELLIKKSGILIIEGDRHDQLKKILNEIENLQYVRAISLRRNSELSPHDSKYYSGGVHILFRNPKFRTIVYIFIVKFETFLKYKIRIAKKIFTFFKNKNEI